MKITAEFAGGLEYLFDGKKSIVLEFREPIAVKTLIATLVSDHLQEREELFVINNSIRPGILVLVNNTDWELEKGPETPLSHNDTVTFISTLHGG